MSYDKIIMKAYIGHPHIEKKQSHRSGRAILKGTNFPVSSVVVYILQQGMSPEELVRAFPHLTLAAVYDALSYYYDHLEEIGAEMEKNLDRDGLVQQLSEREKALRLIFDPKSGEFDVRQLDE